VGGALPVYLYLSAAALLLGVAMNKIIDRQARQRPKVLTIDSDTTRRSVGEILLALPRLPFQKKRRCYSL
jgi:hypothetical protein